MATDADAMELSYFPGCSLATSARENNRSLLKVCKKLGYRIVEVQDWNCCGSSSTHSIQSDLAFHFACRNLSLAPAGRPLLVACPSCMLRLKQAQLHLKEDPEARETYERMWGRPVDPDLDIMHFFELLDGAFRAPDPELQTALKGLRFVPYYGCMLTRPPAMRQEKNYHGLMEKILSACGAQPLVWGQACGSDPHGQPDHPGSHRRQGRLHRHGLRHVLSEPRNPLLAETPAARLSLFRAAFHRPRHGHQKELADTPPGGPRPAVESQGVHVNV
jgi:heterodisulfide reductase subunit B